MVRKLLTALVAASALSLIPSIGNPDALRHPQLWILVAVAVAVSVFQPAYKPVDGSAPPQDHGTAAQIVWSVYLTQLAGILEAVYLRYPESFEWDAITTAALFTMLGGLGLRVWAVLTLGRYFTWFISLRDDHKVIREGPFRYIRHPAYCGAWILFVSTLLFLHAWYGAALSFVVQFFAYARRIRYEEALMMDQLGEDYRSYRREVKAMAPPFW